jgi:O-antigen/teichoic acid export membrane protein
MIDLILKIINHQGVMRYFKNTAWLFAEKTLRIVSSLFVGTWVARYLGPEQYGAFNYVVSFVALFAAFSTLGLDVVLVREIVKNEDKADVLMGTAFMMKVVGALVTMILIIVASYFTLNDVSTNLLIIIVSAGMLFNSFNVIDLYFQSKVLSRYVVYSKVIILLFSSAIKIVLILNEADLSAFVWVVLLDSVALAGGYIIFYYYNSLTLRSWKFEKRIVIDLLLDSWPLVFSGVAIAIYMRVDQVMIKEMMGLNALGQYAAAVKLSEAWYFIPMMIGASLTPAIINAKKVDEKLYYDRLQYLYTFMVWVAIVVAVLMTILSDDIVSVFFGIEYIEAGSVLVIHIWAGIFLSLGVACGKWYLAENYTKGALYKAIFGMTINVLGNYYLIPVYGIQGAAISTLFGHFSANLIYDFFDKRVRVQIKYKFKAFIPLYLLR